MSSVWSGFVALAHDGRLKTVPQVLDELERNDPEGYERLNAVRRQIVIANADYVSAVQAILGVFPTLVRADAISDPADPWLIAVAVRNSYIVVCNELPSAVRRRPDGKIRIPDVCAHYKIPWIDVDELVIQEGLG